jgi:hypothetical protein
MTCPPFRVRKGDYTTRFAVVPGHELPEIEMVVERHAGYLVVEKRQADAQEVAFETDTRS